MHQKSALKNPIYLDYAATTPVSAESAADMMQCLTLSGSFANPASIQHKLGEQANELVEKARAEISKYINCKPSELIFTSGATEANNLAIKGIALSHQHKGKHIITSATEHKAVLDTCKYLESIGFKVSYLRPDQSGLLNYRSILEAITDETILVSIMHVNNETGVIQDIQKIADALKDSEIFFHVDAAQSAGKIAIDLAKTPIDLLSISAHKFYGPKGIGCLFIRDRKKIHLIPISHGGGQEFGLRPGTLATHQIIGMATAFRMAHEEMSNDDRHCKALEKALTDQLKCLEYVHFNGNQEHKFANIINVSFDQVGSDSLIIALRNEVAIASGSACNSGAVEASHVLRAMGIEGDRLYGAVRISFGRYTTLPEIQYAGQRICEEVSRLRQLALE